MSEQTTIGNWRMDGEGYVRYWPTGHIAFRIDEKGTIWVWDKWARDAFGKRRACERPLLMEHLQRFVFQQTHTGGES